MTLPTIAITGAGTCCSLGEGRHAILDAMLAGGVAIDEAPAIEGRFAPDDSGQTPPVRAAQANESAPAIGDASDRAERLLRRTVEAALSEAGLDRATLDAMRRAGRRVESIFGTTLGGMRHLGRAMRSDDLDEFRRTTTATVVRDVLAETGLPWGGPTISAACASGVSAVALGATALLLGEADLVVAIAYDPISEFAFAGFTCLRLVAPGPLRPFDAAREGMRVGEGYGVFVLERSDDAAARRATTIGRVLGWGGASDAHHLTQPVPDGRGAGRAILEATVALRDAGRLPGLIAAHATSTPANDTAEHAAFRNAFGDDLATIPVTALKSRIGHTLGAAGAVELAVVLAAMERGHLPATANSTPDQASFPDLDLVTDTPRAIDASHAVVVSLGFGGADAAIAVERGDVAPIVAPKPPVRSGDEIVVTGASMLIPAAGDLELDPNALDGLDDARAVRRLARFARLVRAAGILAVRDAALDETAIRQASAFVGTRFGAAAYTLDYYDELVRDGLGAGNPLYFAESVPNIGSAQLSLGLGIQGTTLSVSGSMLSGIEALHLARRHLVSGQADRAIVVVAEESHARVADVLRRLGLLDDRGLAEGAGAIVLERASVAAARGARVRGRLTDTMLAWPDRAGLEGVRGVVRSAAGVDGGGIADRAVMIPDPRSTVGRLVRSLFPRTDRAGLIGVPDDVERQSLAPIRPMLERLLDPDGLAGPSRSVWLDPTGAVGSVGIAPVSSDR